MRSRLRRDLTAALKARDPVAVSALRSALAAIENAEAVDADPLAPGGASEHVAGAVAGAGAGDRERRALTDADVSTILRGHVDELDRAAGRYEQLGRLDEASTLRREGAILAGYVEERG